MRPITSLVPYERNPLVHPPEQIEQLASSLLQFGWTNAILVDENSVIIYGHGRRLAALLLIERGHQQFAQAPVVVARGWTEAQKRAYRIADNQLGRMAPFDLPALRFELGELQELNFDVRSLGFDDDAFREIMAEPNAGQADPDEAPEPPADPVSRLGDVWLLGKHRLLCGDSTKAEDVKRVLAGAKPHLMVTDPPYGVEYDPEWRRRVGINASEGKRGKVLNDERADWQAAYNLFPGSVAYVWHAGRHASEVQRSIEAAGFEIRTQIIWAKDRMVLSRGDYHWQHEPCWYAVRKGKPGLWAGDRSQTTLWPIKAREDGGFGHGTQKPVECMRRPIFNNSRLGDAVYEPFSGSGTTVIAAEQEGRVCLAIELSPAYVDVAVERWEKFAGKTARLEGGGTFAEVRAERKGRPEGRPRARRARAAG